MTSMLGGVHRTITESGLALLGGIPKSVRLLLLLVLLIPTACDSAEERAIKHYEKGMELLAQGKNVKAELEFRNAIKLQNEYPEAYLQLGKLLQERNKLAAAVRNFRRVVELDESVLEAHLRLGQIMLANGLVEEALDYSTTAYQLAPEDLAVLVLKASTQLRLDNIETAEKTLDKAFQIDPNHGDVHLVKAAISRKKAGDLRAKARESVTNRAELFSRSEAMMEQALSEVETGLELAPGHLQLALYRIDLLSRMGRDAAVGKALRNLVADNPEELRFRETLVRWYIAQNDMEAAEHELRELAARKPDDPEAALDVVRLIKSTQGTKPALAELKRLIEARESTEAAYPFHEAHVQIDVEEGRIEEGMERLRKIIDDTEPSSHAAIEARVLLARVLLSQEDEAGAQALLDEVIKRNKKHPEALAVRGQILINNGQYDEAVRVLRMASSEAPDNEKILQTLALAHDRNGNRDLAGERMAAAVKVSKFAPGPTLNYAQFLLAEGKIDFAEDLIEDAIRRNPSNADLLKSLGRIRLQQKDWLGVEKVAQALSRIQPKDQEDAKRLMAAALSGQERFDESIELLRESIAPDKGQARGMTALVVTYLRSGELDAAEKYLTEVLDAQPKNPQALALLATVQALTDRPEAAEQNYRAAIANAPEQAQYYSSFSRFLIRQGRLEDAEKNYQQGISAVPRGNSSQLRFGIALLREAQNDIDGAIAQYETLLELNPGSDLIANNLAALISDHRSGQDELERAYNIAKRLRSSKIPQFQDTFGWLAHLTGNTSEALRFLEPASEGLPNHPVVAYHLGAAYAEAGEVDRARANLTRAIALGEERGAEVLQIEMARTLLEDLPERETTQ